MTEFNICNMCWKNDAVLIIRDNYENRTIKACQTCREIALTKYIDTLIWIHSFEKKQHTQKTNTGQEKTVLLQNKTHTQKNNNMAQKNRGIQN